MVVLNAFYFNYIRKVRFKMGLFDFLLFWKKKPKKESVKVEQAKKTEVLEKQEAVAPEPEEPSEVLDKEVIAKEEPVVEEKPVAEEEPKEVSIPAALDVDVYQVKTHDAGGWQVIKKDADRARRRFDTQSECIEYCKQNELKYVVFKKDGSLR
jgi:hypothetical protein